MAATIQFSSPQNRLGSGIEHSWDPIEHSRDHLERSWDPIEHSSDNIAVQHDQRATSQDRPSSGVYWRRRLAVGLLLVVMGAGLWTIATWVTNSSVGVAPVGADRSAPLVEELYIVQPGDTLWSIAASIDEGGDVRATVDWLANRNGGSAIEAGQRIVVGR